MISVELAQVLRDRGLTWRPARYDVFFIPERGLDERVFVLADMTVDIQRLAGGAAITFNGAVEWSLDSILH
ncbi:MAG: pilus assembly protein CpaE, partial [Acidimicrobiia bacterium]|nr:pilus assembly protein CpaE [Acidimicrobiia bacterium]